LEVADNGSCHTQPRVDGNQPSFIARPSGTPCIVNGSYEESDNQPSGAPGIVNGSCEESDNQPSGAPCIANGSYEESADPEPGMNIPLSPSTTPAVAAGPAASTTLMAPTAVASPAAQPGGSATAAMNIAAAHATQVAAAAVAGQTVNLFSFMPYAPPPLAPAPFAAPQFTAGMMQPPLPPGLFPFYGVGPGTRVLIREYSTDDHVGGYLIRHYANLSHGVNMALAFSPDDLVYIFTFSGTRELGYLVSPMPHNSVPVPGFDRGCPIHGNSCIMGQYLLGRLA
jgi:hypothetical protein